jgi:anti-sigma regulatory factor (Ser/Thr protein kinase)
MPARMFVTCLYGVLEPATGRFTFANAGHNLPYVRTADGVIELRATGLPLGLMPGIVYEETEGVVNAGEGMLLYSDGLVEQHGPNREMYGFPRLREAMATDDAGSALLDRLLDELNAFTGPGVEQEDDITLVTLRRSAGAGESAWSEARPEVALTRDEVAAPDDAGAATVDAPLLEFTIEGAIGNERAAMQRVAEAVAPLGLEPARLERLKTAVAETVMNAIEYGSQGDPSVPVDIRVDADDETIRVRVTDRALSGPVPDAEMPDLDAKLEGKQKPRGWGLFLIRHMVDGMDVHAADGLQTVTLTLARSGR